MNDSVLVVVSCGTDNPNRSRRAIHLPSHVLQKGRKNTLFPANERILPAPKGRDTQLRGATGAIAPNFSGHTQDFHDSIVATPLNAKRRFDAVRDFFMEAWPGTAQGLARSSTTDLL